MTQCQICRIEYCDVIHNPIFTFITPDYQLRLCQKHFDMAWDEEWGKLTKDIKKLRK